MVPKTIIVHEDIYDKFVDLLLNKVSNLKYGLPSNPETCLTPVVKMRECIDALNDALSKGAKLLCGGKKVNHAGEEKESGVFFQPTLLLVESDNQKMLDMKCVKDENFFPVIPIIKVNLINLSKRQR
jgi:aldehyde dehydrogenase (NAD+)